MENQNQIKRPDGVWVLVILYCVGIVLNFLLVLLGILVHTQFDPLVLGIAAINLVFRGIGLARLFMLRQDAWIYLLVAFLIALASDAFDYIFGGQTYFVAHHAVVSTVSFHAWGLIMLLYAYRIGKCYAPPPLSA